MVSAAESKPISCVPACVPARLAATSMGLVVAVLLHGFDQREHRAGGRVFFCGVMNFPGPGGIFGLARQQSRGLGDELREYADAHGEIRAPDQARAGFIDSGASAIHLIEPTGGADDDVHA